MTDSTDDAEWAAAKAECYLEDMEERLYHIEFDVEEWTQKGGIKIPISEMEPSHILNCIKRLKGRFRTYGNSKRVLYILLMENELLKRDLLNMKKRLFALEDR